MSQNEELEKITWEALIKSAQGEKLSLEELSAVCHGCGMPTKEIIRYSGVTYE